MAKPTTPRPPMAVINIGYAYVMLPLSQALEVFTALRGAVNVDSDYKAGWKYTSPNNKVQIQHITEEQLLLMDADAALSE